MDKLISNLNMGRHFSVDLADQPLALFLDGESGLIFLNEGVGPGRLNGAVLVPDRCPCFLVRHEESGTVTLLIEYCGKEFLVGKAQGEAMTVTATEWAQGANALLNSITTRESTRK